MPGSSNLVILRESRSGTRRSMNYIHHMNAVFAKFYEDDRLQPNHISLYFVLFQSWNMNRFRNPIILIREDMMKWAKIGSKNTYTKCLKDLDRWGYINYEPSHNPMRGSKVHLPKFDTSGGTSPDTTLGIVLGHIYKQNKQVKHINKHVNQNKNFDEPL